MRIIWLFAAAVFLMCLPSSAGDQGAAESAGHTASDDSETARARKHLGVSADQRSSPPEVKARAWPRTSVDRFILARLEARGLSPSPQADRRTLIRRASFDLTGLPPTPEEVDAFEADTAPDSFDRLVDRLLASPRYGERWGRYWLDVARYADTKGYILFQDANYHWAYTYRDYVIGAFNQDLPYDRFLIEQIAADRLACRGRQKAPDGAGVSDFGRPVHGQCPRCDRRSDRRRLPRADELDGHLRPLSRPQVRSRFPRRITIRFTACWPVLASRISRRKPAEPEQTAAYSAVRQRARIAAAEAQRVRCRQASRNGRVIEAPRG